MPGTSRRKTVRTRTIATGLAAAMLVGPMAGSIAAHAASDVPSVEILPCAERCANFVEAVPSNAHHSGFTELPFDVYVEGLVILSFTIGTDGRVKDPIVEKLIGPQMFADRALSSVKSWTYKPATKDGVPVEQSNWRAELDFRFDTNKGARSEIVYHYGQARRLADDGKYADAIALLRTDLDQPKLNFYERTMIANALSLYYLRSKDYVHALEQVRDATIGNGEYLGKNAWEQAVRDRIMLEALAGQYSEALAWFDILNAKKHVGADDPSAKIAERIKTLLASPQSFSIDATMLAGDDGWDHALARRKFGFDKIGGGTLDHFDLRCDQQSVRSKINDTAEWTVPARFSNCRVYVSGTPGTTFKFLEIAAPVTPASSAH